MAEYGIPYMGSKSSICNDIVKLFPKADNFYDLFGGGFSITHAMLLRRSKDYKQFHFNEIRPNVCELIKDAINGKYSYDNFKPTFVSRQEFLDKKEQDPYIKLIWSFGNNGRSYIFGEDIESYKKSMHNAIVFNDFDDLAKQVIGLSSFKDGYSINQKRLILRNRISVLHKDKTEGEKRRLQQLQQLERLEQLQQLQQLERLQRLQQLQQLERLQRLQFYNCSYDKVPIKENSIIYCDPPYKGTADYGKEFSHDNFFEWCHEQKNPVFISEYHIDDDRFKVVFKIEKRSKLNKLKEFCVNKIEKVYANRAAQELINRKLVQ